MKETKRIAEQLKRAMEGVAWHGPAVLEILSKIDATTACERPIDNIHTIAELTGHITTWHRAVLERLKGADFEPNRDDNWPTYENLGGEQWEAIKKDLNESYQMLYHKIIELSDNSLEKLAPGKQYDIYHMLHGVIQHDLYHAGQMAILRKTSLGF